MNKFLANGVGFVNALVACLLIAAGTIVGMHTPLGHENGGAVGFLIGLTAAILVCGLVALVIDMRNELVLIRKSLVLSPTRPEAPTRPETPKEKRSTLLTESGRPLLPPPRKSVSPTPTSALRGSDRASSDDDAPYPPPPRARTRWLIWINASSPKEGGISGTGPRFRQARPSSQEQEECSV